MDDPFDQRKVAIVSILLILFFLVLPVALVIHIMSGRTESLTPLEAYNLCLQKDNGFPKLLRGSSVRKPRLSPRRVPLNNYSYSTWMEKCKYYYNQMLYPDPDKPKYCPSGF